MAFNPAIPAPIMAMRGAGFWERERAKRLLGLSLAAPAVSAILPDCSKNLRLEIAVISLACWMISSVETCCFSAATAIVKAFRRELKSVLFE